MLQLAMNIIAALALGVTAYMSGIVQDVRTSLDPKAALADHEIIDQAGCNTAGRLWCPSVASTPAYCAPVGTTSCPIAPTAESCKAQNMYLCGSTAAPYCSSLPCTEVECTAAAKKWCKPAPGSGTVGTGPGGGGWCTESTGTCPAYTEVDCTAQNGKWCLDSYSTAGGWCMTGLGTCPHTCPQGQYWDGTACRSSTPTPTPTPTPAGCATFITQPTCIATSDCRWNVPATGSAYCSMVYTGDANSCPGFSYSVWDSTNKRYCRLNNQESCQYNYPDYLDISKYSSSGCPASSPTPTPAPTPTPSPTPDVPVAPSNLIITVTGSTVNLKWVDNSTNEDSFKVYRSSGSGYWSQAASFAAGAISFFETGLATGNYEYYISACNKGGCSNSNTVSLSITESVPATPPNTPPGFKATALSSSSVQLEWIDDGFQTNFSISRRLQNGNWLILAVVSPTDTTYTNSGLALGVYEYRIKACNEAGCSPDSPVAAVTLKGGTESVPTPTAPVAPSDLKAIQNGSTISLSWKDNSDNETEFKVFQRDPPATNWFQIGMPAATNITTFVDDYIYVGTVEYRVNACNASGCSTDSNVATVTITVVPIPTLTPTPVPVPTPISCPQPGQTAETKYYCTSSSGGSSGWCSSTPCNRNDCEVTGKRWCDPPPLTPGSTYTSSGWCQEKNYNCPAYTAPDCKVQGGEWCESTSGGSGWCATGGARCPNEALEKKGCLDRKGSWCLPQGGGYGWCAAVGTRCPAYTPEECVAEGGKWCKNPPSTSGAVSLSAGYCTTGTGARCPVYTEEECQAEAGTWCLPTNGVGWCVSSSSTCPSGSTPSKPKITPVPLPEPIKLICPLASYLPCPTGYKEIFEKTKDGCVIQRCLPPGGEIKPEHCPDIAIKSCPGGTVEKKEDRRGCPIYECRTRVCPSPPPAEQCVSGWTPNYSKGLDCPFYECQNTAHSEMEGCVKRVVGEAFFEQMKRGALSDAIMRSLISKIETAGCFRQVSPTPTPTPKPEPTPDFTTQCPLEKMKREMTSGLLRRLQQIGRDVDQNFRRSGVPVPASYSALLTKIKTVVSSVSGAANCSEIYELGRDLPELLRQLEEQVLDIEHTAQVGEAIKKLTAELVKIEREWARVLKRLPAELRSESDSEFKSRVNALRAAIEAIRQAAATGDPDRIENAARQAFEQLEEVRQTLQVGQMVRQLSTFIRQVNREVSRAERLANRLVKAGEDVSELQDTILGTKEVLSEVNKNRLSCIRKPTDTCVDLFERLMVMRGELSNAVAEASGALDDYKLFLGLGKLGEKLQESRQTITGFLK